MTFTDRDGITWQDIVRCARCGFTDADLNLFTCPDDGATLGETSRRVTDGLAARDAYMAQCARNTRRVTTS